MYDEYFWLSFGSLSYLSNHIYRITNIIEIGSYLNIMACTCKTMYRQDQIPASIVDVILNTISTLKSYKDYHTDIFAFQW